jgi:hypothetical protein
MNFDREYFCIDRYNYKRKKYRYTMGDIYQSQDLVRLEKVTQLAFMVKKNFYRHRHLSGKTTIYNQTSN